MTDYDFTDHEIYVASLSDYNNAILHGVHIEIDETTDIDEIWDAVNEMLKQSPTAKEMGVPAEEWAIHDYYLGGIAIDESESFEDIITHAQLLAEFGGAWAAYCEHESMPFDGSEDAHDVKRRFEDMYRGEYESTEEFAQELADDMGIFSDASRTLQNYFDWESFTRDLFMDDFYYIRPSYHYRSIYVFSRY